MLTCVLGNGGEVLFPKLGKDQMLILTSIFDKLVKSEDFTKAQLVTAI